MNNEPTIQTADLALTAFMASHDIPYRAIPNVLPGHKVEVQFFFKKNTETEKLVKEFESDRRLQAFLRAAHEIKDVAMKLVRAITTDSQKRPNPLKPKCHPDLRRYSF